MIVGVCLQYSKSILTEIFVHSNIKCLVLLDFSSVLLVSSLYIWNFEYLFTGDAELVYLSNLEVLNLQNCGLNGSLPFKGKHSNIYFYWFPSINLLNGSHFKYFLPTLLSSILLVDMTNFSSLEILDLRGNDF